MKIDGRIAYTLQATSDADVFDPNRKIKSTVSDVYR